MKIGEIERVVNLTFENDTTLSFIAPPIEWIKNTKYLTSEEEDVEIQQPDEVEETNAPNKTEENADEEKEMTKDEKVDLIIKKAKIESAEFAEKMFNKYYNVNHNENVSVGFTLNNIEW